MTRNNENIFVSGMNGVVSSTRENVPVAERHHEGVRPGHRSKDSLLPRSYHEECIQAIREKTAARATKKEPNLETGTLDTKLEKNSEDSDFIQAIQNSTDVERQSWVHTVYVNKGIPADSQKHYLFNESGDIFAIVEHGASEIEKITFYNQAGEVEDPAPVDLLDRAAELYVGSHNLVYGTKVNNEGENEQINLQKAENIRKELLRQKNLLDSLQTDNDKNFNKTLLPRLLAQLRDPSVLNNPAVLLHELKDLANTNLGVKGKEVVQSVLGSNNLISQILGLLLLILIKLLSKKNIAGASGFAHMNIEKFMKVANAASEEDRKVLVSALVKILGQTIDDKGELVRSDKKNELTPKESKVLKQHWKKYYSSLSVKEQEAAKEQAKLFKIDSEDPEVFQQATRHAISRAEKVSHHEEPFHDAQKDQIDALHSNNATKSRRNQESAFNETQELLVESAPVAKQAEADEQSANRDANSAHRAAASIETPTGQGGVGVGVVSNADPTDQKKRHSVDAVLTAALAPAPSITRKDKFSAVSSNVKSAHAKEVADLAMAGMTRKEAHAVFSGSSATDSTDSTVSNRSFVDDLRNKLVSSLPIREAQFEAIVKKLYERHFGDSEKPSVITELNKQFKHVSMTRLDSNQVAEIEESVIKAGLAAEAAEAAKAAPASNTSKTDKIGSLITAIATNKTKLEEIEEKIKSKEQDINTTISLKLLDNQDGSKESTLNELKIELADLKKNAKTYQDQSAEYEKSAPKYFADRLLGDSTKPPYRIDNVPTDFKEDAVYLVRYLNESKRKNHEDFLSIPIGDSKGNAVTVRQAIEECLNSPAGFTLEQAKHIVKTANAVAKRAYENNDLNENKTMAEKASKALSSDVAVRYAESAYLTQDDAGMWQVKYSMNKPANLSTDQDRLISAKETEILINVKAKFAARTGATNNTPAFTDKTVARKALEKWYTDLFNTTHYKTDPTAAAPTAAAPTAAAPAAAAVPAAAAAAAAPAFALPNSAPALLPQVASANAAGAAAAATTPSDTDSNIFIFLQAFQADVIVQDSQVTAATAFANVTTKETAFKAAEAAKTAAEDALQAARAQAAQASVANSGAAPAAAQAAQAAQAALQAAQTELKTAQEELTKADKQKEILDLTADFAVLSPLQQKSAIADIATKIQEATTAAGSTLSNDEKLKIVKDVVSALKPDASKNTQELVDNLAESRHYCFKIREAIASHFSNGFGNDLKDKDVEALVKKLGEPTGFYKDLDKNVLKELIKDQYNDMKKQASVLMLDKVLLAVDSYAAGLEGHAALDAMMPSRSLFLRHGQVTDTMRENKYYEAIITNLSKGEQIKLEDVSMLLLNKQRPVSQSERSYCDHLTKELNGLSTADYHNNRHKDDHELKNTRTSVGVAGVLSEVVSRYQVDPEGAQRRSNELRNEALRPTPSR